MNGIGKHSCFLMHWLESKESIRSALKKAKLGHDAVEEAVHLVYLGIFDQKYPHWKQLLFNLEPEKRKKDVQNLYKGIHFLKEWLDTDKSYNEAIIESKCNTPLCNFMEKMVEDDVFKDIFPDWKQKLGLLKQIEKDSMIYVKGDSDYSFLEHVAEWNKPMRKKIKT